VQEPFVSGADTMIDRVVAGGRAKARPYAEFFLRFTGSCR